VTIYGIDFVRQGSRAEGSFRIADSPPKTSGLACRIGRCPTIPIHPYDTLIDCGLERHPAMRNGNSSDSSDV
jgi:hypothetical protein